MVSVKFWCGKFSQLATGYEWRGSDECIVLALSILCAYPCVWPRLKRGLRVALSDFLPVSLGHLSKHGVQYGFESNADYVQDLPCLGRTNVIQPWAHLWWSKLPKRRFVRDKVSLRRIRWKLGHKTRWLSVDGCPQKEDYTAQKEDKKSTQAAQEQNRHRDMCNLWKSQAWESFMWTLRGKNQGRDQEGSKREKRGQYWMAHTGHLETVQDIAADCHFQGERTICQSDTRWRRKWRKCLSFRECKSWVKLRSIWYNGNKLIYV